MDATLDHAAVSERLGREVVAACTSGKRLRLKKDTSNLFRPADGAKSYNLDARRLNRVLRIDAPQRLADVEGLITYEDLVEATLPHGLLPAVVPQLKTITVGGAVSGLGIESSSFRYGLAHETVESMEVLLGNGEIIQCSRLNNREIFLGIPNSYGTLGFVLGLQVRLIPAKRFVHLLHTRFRRTEDFLQGARGSEADYVDGTIFARDELYLTEGRFADDAPRTSNYTYLNIYYRSIRKLAEDWMTARQYIWRWDTDWFWCSKQFGLQNRALRFFAKPWLNSRSYQKWMRAAQRWLPDSGRAESVIQDVQIPFGAAAEFLDFLLSEVSITPVWICPLQTSGEPWLLTALQPRQWYINFGFWDVVPAQGGRGRLNRRIEEKVRELGGTKGLYSSSYYDENEFWKIYDHSAYRAIKERADPAGVLPELFETVVSGRRV